MTGTLEAIYTAPAHGQAQTSQSKATLTAEVGLAGDRYAGSGVVTLIEGEQIDAFNAATGLDISYADSGRNLVTRGVALNPLVGKQFQLGDALLEGFELCEPCATLGARLSTETVGAAEIVKQFTSKAGIRARVLGSSDIVTGSAIDT